MDSNNLSVFMGVVVVFYGRKLHVYALYMKSKFIGC